MITPTMVDTGRILDMIAAGDTERLARVALALLREPGDLDASHLDADSAAAVVRSLLDQRQPPLTADRLNEALAATKRLGFHVLIPGDEYWPACLADLAPPSRWRCGRAAVPRCSPSHSPGASP